MADPNNIATGILLALAGGAGAVVSVILQPFTNYFVERRQDRRNHRSWLREKRSEAYGNFYDVAWQGMRVATIGDLNQRQGWCFALEDVEAKAFFYAAGPSKKVFSEVGDGLRLWMKDTPGDATEFSRLINRLDSHVSVALSLNEEGLGTGMIRFMILKVLRALLEKITGQSYRKPPTVTQPTEEKPEIPKT